MSLSPSPEACPSRLGLMDVSLQSLSESPGRLRTELQHDVLGRGVQGDNAECPPGRHLSIKT